MDAIDILGSLLGHKSSGSGRGADILRDIFKGGSRSPPQPESSPAPPSRALRPVYTASLIAIDLDADREADYLTELAHGLRIPRQVRDQIHRRLGAPRVQ